MSDDISRAIVMFIAFGAARWPQSNADAVTSAFGERRAAVLLAEIHEILKAMGAIAIDWQSETLASASAKMCDEMKERYPALSDQALNALAWRFSYDWK